MRSAMFSEHTAFTDATVSMDFYRFSSVGWFLDASRFFFVARTLSFSLSLSLSLDVYVLLCFVCFPNTCTQKMCTLLLLLLMRCSRYTFFILLNVREQSSNNNVHRTIQKTNMTGWIQKLYNQLESRALHTNRFIHLILLWCICFLASCAPALVNVSSSSFYFFVFFLSFAGRIVIFCTQHKLTGFYLSLCSFLFEHRMVNGKNIPSSKRKNKLNES